MTFQRGDVVLIPFPYTDLSASKTRPAVVVSGDVYHKARSELLLAYVSSQVSRVNSTIDYVLTRGHLPFSQRSGPNEWKKARHFESSGSTSSPGQPATYPGCTASRTRRRTFGWVRISLPPGLSSTRRRGASRLAIDRAGQFTHNGLFGYN